MQFAATWLTSLFEASPIRARSPIFQHSSFSIRQARSGPRSQEAAGPGDIYEVTSRVAPFDKRRKKSEFPDYVPVFFPVMIKIGRHYMNPAAQAASPAKRHALPDALFSGNAVYTLDNGPFARLRQNERPSFQFRPPQFFDRRIKIGNPEINNISEHKFCFRPVYGHKK